MTNNKSLKVYWHVTEQLLTQFYNQKIPTRDRFLHFFGISAVRTIKMLLLSKTYL